MRHIISKKFSAYGLTCCPAANDQTAGIRKYKTLYFNSVDLV